MAYRQTDKVLEHKEQTRDAILLAASKLVRQEKSLTMEAVAAGAGLSVGSLYTYFRNRSDLMASLFEFRAEHELAAMREALASDPDPITALRTAVRVQFARARANPGMTLFLLLERMDRDQRMERLKLDYHRKHCAALAEVIEAGVRSGQFKPQVAELSAAVILGAIIEVVTRALTPGDRLATIEQSTLLAEIEIGITSAVSRRT